MELLIKKLNNKSESTAKEISALFQVSYQIEAELLGVIDFPPLNRKLFDYINCNTDFYGCCKDNKLVAIIEVKSGKKITDIHSLVVHPDHFRQGLGKQLMQFILKLFDSEKFTVETGFKNKPAAELYLKLGFKEQKQWETETGIRKIKFIKTQHNRP